ncbi:MAG: MFS transporter [Athalassotoga sp.]|uniref:MFS transporter n=1 Tax=Athalassotoga sp. TaxID=2022597 RepID=UPI003D05EC11
MKILKSRFHIYHLFSNTYSILLYLLITSINAIAAQWNLSFFTIGILNFVGALFYVIASLFFGRIGDRIGQKKVLIFSVFLFLIFSIYGFFLSNILDLFIFTMGFNFFFGTFFPQIEGLLSKREKELGIDPVNTINRFTISWSLGNIIGVAMGPFLIIKFPYVVFGYGIVLNLSSYLILKKDFARHGESISFEPSPELKKSSNTIDFPKISLYRTVYRSTYFLLGLIYSAIIPLFPKLINMNGLPIGITGFIIVGTNIGVVLTFILLERLKSWVGNPKTAAIFLIVFPLMTLFIFMRPTPVIFFVISFLAGMSYAIPYTYAIFYGLNSQKADHGKQGGFHEAITGLTTGIGPLLGGLALQISNGLMGLGFMAIFILVTISAIQLWFIKKTKHVIQN